jgi:hypothetical protein
MGMKAMLHGLGPDRNHPPGGRSQPPPQRGGPPALRRWTGGVITLALLSTFSPGLAHTYYVEGEFTYRHFADSDTWRLHTEQRHQFRFQRHGMAYRIESFQKDGITDPTVVTDFLYASDETTSYSLVMLHRDRGVSSVHDHPYPPPGANLTPILWLAYASDQFVATNRFRDGIPLSGMRDNYGRGDALDHTVAVRASAPGLPSSIRVRAPGYRVYFQGHGRETEALPEPFSGGWWLSEYAVDTWLDLPHSSIPKRFSYREFIPVRGELAEQKINWEVEYRATNAIESLVLDLDPAFSGLFQVVDSRFPHLRLHGRPYPIRYLATNELWRPMDDPELVTLVADAQARLLAATVSVRRPPSPLIWAALCALLAPVILYLITHNRRPTKRRQSNEQQLH